MAIMAVKMDFADTNNTNVMKKENPYIDLMNSHVRDHKTLTMQTFNSIIHKVMQKTTMDVEQVTYSL